MSRIPIILVTGFLGSGKTTFLRRLAELHPEKRLLFLVNEFSETGVDAATLAVTGRPTQSVVGGSLFCECKASEFVRVMRERVLGGHKENPLDAVIIETSGIADPEAIGRLMCDHGLSEHFEVQQIITIAAPKHLPKLHANMPSIRAQIQTSHLVVLNKTDLATVEEIQRAEAVIHENNPKARIIQAAHCQIEFPLDNLHPDLPNAPLSTVDANPFTTETLRLPEAIPMAQLTTWLSELPDSILRVKGTISTDQGWFEVQKTVDNSELTPADPATESTLVLIVHDDDTSDLQTVIEQIGKKSHETKKRP